MRDRLNDLGLVSFCKTTGGKGLHVVTPLAIAKRRRTALSWPQAKGFAHDVCLQMARDNPSIYLIKMSKSLRNTRIFLDYLSNDRRDGRGPFRRAHGPARLYRCQSPGAVKPISTLSASRSHSASAAGQEHGLKDYCGLRRSTRAIAKQLPSA
jgi:hypothetical protein